MGGVVGEFQTQKITLSLLHHCRSTGFNISVLFLLQGPRHVNHFVSLTSAPVGMFLTFFPRRSAGLQGEWGGVFFWL